MTMVLQGIGLVLVVEGLLLALAPNRIVEILQAVARMPVQARRLIGLIALTLGVLALGIVRALGG